MVQHLFGTLSTVLVQPQPVSYGYTPAVPCPAWGRPLTGNPLPRSLSYGLLKTACNLRQIYLCASVASSVKVGTVAALISWWS